MSAVRECQHSQPWRLSNLSSSPRAVFCTAVCNEGPRLLMWALCLRCHREKKELSRLSIPGTGEPPVPCTDMGKHACLVFLFLLLPEACIPSFSSFHGSFPSNKHLWYPHKGSIFRMCASDAQWSSTSFWHSSLVYGHCAN